EEFGARGIDDVRVLPVLAMMMDTDDRNEHQAVGSQFGAIERGCQRDLSDHERNSWEIPHGLAEETVEVGSRSFFAYGLLVRPLLYSGIGAQTRDGPAQRCCRSLY